MFTENLSVGAVADATKKQLETLGYMAMSDSGSYSLCLGAGYLHPFPEKVFECLRQLDKEKEAKKKRHNRLVMDIQDRLRELRAQSIQLGKELAKLEEKMGGLDEMASQAGVQFDGTETDAQKKQKMQDSYELILANSGTLTPQQQEWLDTRIEQQEVDDNIATAEAMVERGAPDNEIIEFIENNTMNGDVNSNFALDSDNSHVVEIGENIVFAMDQTGDLSTVVEAKTTNEENIELSEDDLFAEFNNLPEPDHMIAEGDIVNKSIESLKPLFANAVTNIQPVLGGDNNLDTLKNKPPVGATSLIS